MAENLYHAERVSSIVLHTILSLQTLQKERVALLE